MRRFLELMLFLIIVVLLSSNAYADFDEPILEPFYAYVSNAGGADYYTESSFYSKEQKSSGKLKYKEEIYIIKEYSFNNKTYCEFLIDDNKYYVELSNLKSMDKEFKNINNEITHEIVVLSENGVEMRKGPSKNYYSVVGKIPKGEKLAAYAVKEYEVSIPWVYVEYNGESGWISYENNEIGHTYKTTRNVLVVEETLIYSDLEMSNEVGKIPSYKEINAKDLISLNFRNLFLDDETKKAFKYDKNNIDNKNYIHYDGKEGYIILKEFGIECNENYKVHLNNLQMYDVPNDGGKILCEIPAGTEISYTYSSKMRRLDGVSWDYGIWAYTQYNGKSGWVQVIDDTYLEKKNEAIEYITEKNKGEDNNSKNYYFKLAVVIISTIVLVCLITALIYVEKNKNK